MENEQLLNSNLNTNNEVYTDEFGNPVQTQYVDEFGNPIDPSLIDENGNYIGQPTQYVDEFGNPIDPSLIDENGNYIGQQEFVNESGQPVNQTTPTIDKQEIANSLNQAADQKASTELVTGVQTAPITSASATAMDDKEMFGGMVTFDYNNVPITDIVNSIILDAINKGASDIHFDPFDEGIKIRIRIDGQLNDYSIVPLYVKKNMITRIKIISGMNITEARTPQDGAIRTELQNKTVDLRVSCLPTNLGEKIVIRIMDYSMSAAGIEALDFNEKNIEKVKHMLALPNGIILVTGATGSGKSTTVYSMLQKLNIEGTNLITVEDPIEMSIGGINQVQAVPEIGLTFATVLRSILRQDPDVIMIGEIRDDETARIAVRASITGHLVLSTIHTNNSLSTIERLTDMSVERYLLGSSLEGIVSQKLARRLCPKCKRLRTATDYEKETFKKALNKDIEEIYEPVGCPECSRGYRGRIAIHEVLLMTQQIRDAITKGVQKDILRKLVYIDGDTETMLQDGLEKVINGDTSFDEILKLIDLEDDLGSNTQLGLAEQLNDSQQQIQTPMMMAPNMMPQGYVPQGQPIYIPYPVAAQNDDTEEEVIIRPTKKKRTIVEMDPEELSDYIGKPKVANIEKSTDEEIQELDLDEETTPTSTQEQIKDEVQEPIKEENEELEEVELVELDTDEETGKVIEKPAKPEHVVQLRKLLDQYTNLLGELHETKRIIGKKKFNIKVQEIMDKLEPLYKQITDIDDNFRFDNKTEDDLKDLVEGIAITIKLLTEDTEIDLYNKTMKRINNLLGVISSDVDLKDITYKAAPQIEKKKEVKKEPIKKEKIKKDDDEIIELEIDESPEIEEKPKNIKEVKTSKKVNKPKNSKKMTDDEINELSKQLLGFEILNEDLGKAEPNNNEIDKTILDLDDISNTKAPDDLTDKLDILDLDDEAEPKEEITQFNSSDIESLISELENLDETEDK